MTCESCGGDLGKSEGICDACGQDLSPRPVMRGWEMTASEAWENGDNRKETVRKVAKEYEGNER